MSYARQEHKDSLVLVLPAKAHHRLQLSAISKVRVNDINKRINMHIIIVLIINKVKR